MRIIEVPQLMEKVEIVLPNGQKAIIEVSFDRFLMESLDNYEPLGKGLENARKGQRIAEVIEAGPAVDGEKKLFRFDDGDYDVVAAAIEVFVRHPKVQRSIGVIRYLTAVKDAQRVDGTVKQAK